MLIVQSILLVLLFGFNTFAADSGFESVKKFKGLSIGSNSSRKVSEVMKSYPGDVIRNEPEKFSIFYYNKDLELVCYNLLCGEWAKIIVEHGGNIEAGSDWKHGRSLGLRPLMGKKGWESPTERVAKVVINGKVHSIYINVKPLDFAKIIESLRREKVAN